PQLPGLCKRSAPRRKATRDVRGATTLRMAELLLGPVLRHVGERDATIWVETSGSCEVEVQAGAVAASTRTFGVAGHHYAIVVLTGLEPASSTPYEVLLDGGGA